MAEWFEVYEDETGLAAAQLRGRRLVLAFAAIAGVIVAASPVVAIVRPAWSGIAAGVAGTLLVASAAWTAWSLGRMRRVVWRIELSVHHVVGHDVTGTRRVVGWPDVRWVNLDDGGLGVSGRRLGRRVQFQIPSSFPDYGRVGHRLVSYAEALGRPVYVDGRAWQALEIGPLLPLLTQRRQPTR